MRPSDGDRGMARIAVVNWSAGALPPGLPGDSDAVCFVPVADADALKRAIPDIDVVFLWDFPPGVLEPFWTRARKLRWVHVAAAGVDAVLFPAFVASEVKLTNSGGILDLPMAEYALALMLALAKDLPRTLRLQQEHTWAYREPESLRGRHLLVLGVGGIGTAVARLSKAVGMRVTGVGRTARAATLPFDHIASGEQLIDLVPEADFVVIALPLTPETNGIYSRQLIESMRPSARLVNLARGALVDEEALVEALQRGRIAGAALDVFHIEPLPPDHPLWETPNVIISPHMSGDVPEVTSAFVELFLRNFDRFQRGKPLLNEVDKRLGFLASRSLAGKEPL